jgi:nitrite reductase/ring-hydroxylating ferredoxin subunit
MKWDRRGILDWMRRGLFGLCLGGGALLAGHFARPPRKRELSKLIAVGSLRDLPVGTSKELPRHNVHLIHDHAGIYAISGRCTHLGCSVLRHPDGFDCPCHGATFDLEGAVISGPAPAPLTWYRVTVDTKPGRRRIWLHLDQRVALGTRAKV